MKKTLILMLAVAAFTTAGCKKKASATKTKTEKLDKKEAAGYRNPVMVKELTD